MPGDLDHSRVEFLRHAGFSRALKKRCPDVVRAWLAEGMPRWREDQPGWCTLVWWESLPASFREGLEFFAEAGAFLASDGLLMGLLDA